MSVKVSVKQANPGWLKTRLDKAKGLGGKEVVAGFPKGSKKASSTYDNGFSVLDNAITQNFGASINHPGGQPFFKDKQGNIVYVSKNSPRASKMAKTKPHKIVIPARNFMDEAVRILEEDSSIDAAQIAKDVMDGKITAKQGLKRIGIVAEDAIRVAIENGDYEPNRPATVKRKGSSKPLIDTGRLRQAVSSIVRDRSN